MRGRKTGGRDWGKDNPPPKSPGTPKLTKEARELKAMTADSYIKLVTKYLYMPVAEIKEAIKNNNLPALELYICTCIASGIKTGDYWKLDRMLDRLIGRVKVEMKLDNANPLVSQTILVEHAEFKQLRLSNETINELKVIG